MSDNDSSHSGFPKNPAHLSTARIGTAAVRLIFEANHVVFTEIPQQNDFGIDAIAEVTKDGFATGVCVGIQIKSGVSYFDVQSATCKFPVGRHAQYWMTYPMPIFGIVFLPEKNLGYWVDIKNYLKSNRGCSTIEYGISEINTLDVARCAKFFLPYLMKTVPNIPFEDALTFFRSDCEEEHYAGLVILFRHFHHDKRTWEAFLTFFTSHEPEKISPRLIYYLAHIPWHGDCAGPDLTKECREYGKELLRELSREQLVKLLTCIDENGVGRGSIGQSIAAIICMLPNATTSLVQIARDRSLGEEVRANASLLKQVYFT